VEAAGLTPAPRRRFGSKVQYVVTLDTQRFGDWIVVEIERGSTEKQILAKLTRTQKRKVKSISLIHKFKEVEA
jgi:hypothetical protein